ncbi:hypothetical protein B9Z52_16550 [Limnohabitans sp. Jir72]|nr:hypothetical protein B9Z52_16550 [Limnohabitans sp. Jir72]
MNCLPALHIAPTVADRSANDLSGLRRRLNGNNEDSQSTFFPIMAAKLMTTTAKNWHYGLLNATRLCGVFF